MHLGDIDDAKWFSFVSGLVRHSAYEQVERGWLPSELIATRHGNSHSELGYDSFLGCGCVMLRYEGTSVVETNPDPSPNRVVQQRPLWPGQPQPRFVRFWGPGGAPNRTKPGKKAAAPRPKPQTLCSETSASAWARAQQAGEGFGRSGSYLMGFHVSWRRYTRTK